jgi:hypothetical protein
MKASRKPQRHKTTPPSFHTLPTPSLRLSSQTVPSKDGTQHTTLWTIIALGTISFTSGTPKAGKTRSTRSQQRASESSLIDGLAHLLEVSGIAHPSTRTRCGWMASTWPTPSTQHTQRTSSRTTPQRGTTLSCNLTSSKSTAESTQPIS